MAGLLGNIHPLESLWSFHWMSQHPTEPTWNLCLSWTKTQLCANLIDSTTKDNTKQTHTHKTCIRYLTYCMPTLWKCIFIIQYLWSRCKWTHTTDTQATVYHGSNGTQWMWICQLFPFKTDLHQRATKMKFCITFGQYGLIVCSTEIKKN